MYLIKLNQHVFCGKVLRYYFYTRGESLDLFLFSKDQTLSEITPQYAGQDLTQFYVLISNKKSEELKFHLL